MDLFLYLGIVISIICLIGFIFYLFFIRNIKDGPQLIITIDITGRKIPIGGCTQFIEEYINKYGFLFYKEVAKAKENFFNAKQNEESKIKKSLLIKKRKDYYLNKIDYLFDINKFKIASFRVVRKQTRYRQKKYIKTPYTVITTVAKIEYTYDGIIWLYKKLKDIKFSTTLVKYSSNEQRKLLTKELRKYIMERDNYTCQKCGKYMPDEVGLQIDHIIPVSRGGKTIPSNLQVLCSKCNARKSNK